MPTKKEEDEWFEQIGYLPQAEQEAIFAEMGYSPTGGFSGFGGEESFYDTGMEDFPFSGVANIPEYTTKGNLDPFDLTQAAKRLNYTQDLAGASVDNVFSALAGPGAYDVNAFTPQLEYGKEVTRPGTERLQAYAQRGGWEGYIANEILSGATPSSAMASLQSFLENAPPEDPDRPTDADNAYQSIIDSLPRSRETGGTPSEKKAQGFWADYDYDTLYRTASDYSDAVFKDPGFGHEEVGPDGRTRYYDAPPEEIKTPQMEWFDKYGLPYPTASYEDPKYLEAMLNADEGTDPAYRQAEAQEYLGGYQDVVGKTKAAEQAMVTQREQDDAMIKAWEAAQPEPVVTRPATTTVPGRAGIETGRQMTMGSEGAGRLSPTVDERMLPTTVMQPGRVPVAPATKPSARPGIWGGMLNAISDLPPQMPMVRTLASGETGLVDATDEEVGNAFGDLGLWKAQQGETRDGIFDRAPKGSKDRRMTAKDVDRKEITKRAGKANQRAVAARATQRNVEAQDPRLNDLTRAGYLYGLASAGRNPLNDAMAQRRAAAARMGL